MEDSEVFLIESEFLRDHFPAFIVRTQTLSRGYNSIVMYEMPCIIALNLETICHPSRPCAHVHVLGFATKTNNVDPL